MNAGEGILPPGRAKSTTRLLANKSLVETSFHTKGFSVFSVGSRTLALKVTLGTWSPSFKVLADRHLLTEDPATGKRRERVDSILMEMNGWCR